MSHDHAVISTVLHVCRQENFTLKYCILTQQEAHQLNKNYYKTVKYNQLNPGRDKKLMRVMRDIRGDYRRMMSHERGYRRVHKGSEPLCLARGPKVSGGLQPHHL